LEINCDQTLSNFDFSFKLRRYTTGLPPNMTPWQPGQPAPGAGGGGGGDDAGAGSSPVGGGAAAAMGLGTSSADTGGEVI